MRAVVQRVTKASVVVGNELVSQIGKGLCILIGISRNDKIEDADYIIRKILNLRIFENESGKKWDCSVKDKNYEILCVSQFTLYSVLKGNKPDFHNAMDSTMSKQFYYDFLNKLKNSYNSNLVKDGKFGEYMNVEIENDGPVTIILESNQDKQ